jgi:hypothetical protein
MLRSIAISCFVYLTLGSAIVTDATEAVAGEQILEFKFVVKKIDMKTDVDINTSCRGLATGNWFGVAYFKDGRVAVKDFVASPDGEQGCSTYTFEDGSSITASYSHGKYTILSGTGLYAKATGTGSFDAIKDFKDGASLLTGKFNVNTPD